ncbi:GIY-YIG nuclease family protein [Flexivirga endophytica]|uniref:GIY-YIG nuclease family protein n=1 Tax=Flexivirga endophytica TaxID=1849103 RepID=UPI0016641821|nr:hypothetical protein [Flexivirga endophytica]
MTTDNSLSRNHNSHKEFHVTCADVLDRGGPWSHRRYSRRIDGIGPAFEAQPLYVGKAEKSLNGRDVRTHFATGKTGSSTVRRSLAALLVDQLELVAVPRNVTRPSASANHALDTAGDERLSRWMDGRLLQATWVKPATVVLGDVETAVLLRLQPPLNLDNVGQPRDRLRGPRHHVGDTQRRTLY